MPQASVAALTGAFALAGVVITAVLGLVGYRIKTKHELEKELRTRHFDRKLQAYSDAIEIAEAIFLTGYAQPSLEKLRSVNRELLLIGSPEVVVAFNAIGDTSPEKLLAQGMTMDQVLALRTEVARKLYNVIRIDLYPGLHALSDSDIRFIEPKAHSVIGT